MTAKSSLITRSNIQELTSNDILTFNSKEYWHKFILENAGLYDKETVLLAVLKSIAPFDLVPTKYTVEGKNAYFLARNCGQAIEKFCLNSLIPIQMNNPPGEIIMSIQTCSVSINEYKMNMQFHLKKAIEKRYDKSHEGFIDLSAFHKEPELYEILFCPLSLPRFFVYVLSILRRTLSITAIDLSSNNIEALKPLEILSGFEGLVSVDLSNNEIKDQNLSEVLQKAVPGLKELKLSGNPVCSTFTSELNYLRWITEKNTCLKKLDGILISYGFPNQQVYLCSNKAQGIVNDFLKHFFTLYDDNREALQHTYHENAIFSIMCNCMPLQNDSKLECYNYVNKNLLMKSDEKTPIEKTYLKNENIMNMLKKLPVTEHDPQSFKVDVLFYKDPVIIIVVCGIFKDIQEPPIIRSFSRTFALKRIGTEEFKITNDLLYVTNATDDEVNASLFNSKAKKQKPEAESYLTVEEKENFIQVVSKLTEMNSTYSKRCLEDCNWDLKKALEVFLDNYDASNIPQDAFAKKFTN